MGWKRAVLIQQGTPLDSKQEAWNRKITTKGTSGALQLETGSGLGADGQTGEDASDLKSIVTREGTQLIYWPACWSVLDKDLKGIFAVGPQVHRCWEWVT